MKRDFSSFVKELKVNFSQEKPAVIVLGNEAADLDSMASALTYAWYLSLTEPEAKVFPLMNIPRGDFKLRTEAVFLFSEAGIIPDSLLFLDDVDLQDLAARGHLKLVLVDHNKIAAGQSGLNTTVAEILDHHADEKGYPQTARTDIRPVGSTATLVGERFLENHQEELSTPLATLLLGTILLDTVNLDPAAERVTPEDNVVAGRLMELTGLQQQPLFDKLQFEKFNVSALGSYDLLRKDYKEWVMGGVKCGIGSVLMSAEDWLKKDPHILTAFESYRKERGLDVLFAMGAYTEPEFRRNLVVYIPDAALRQTVLDFLEASDLALELMPTDHDEETGLLFYSQGNLGVSRKKLQPLLARLFTS